MSPLELIKNGILENDFQKVIQGYEALTGEDLSSIREEDPTTSREESTSDQSEEVRRPQVPVRSSELDFTVQRDELPNGKFGRKESIQVGANQFVDDGSESQGKEFDTPKVEPTPRRSPVKMIEVVCNACGAKEEINPKYKTGSYHRCGKCVG